MFFTLASLLFACFAVAAIGLWATSLYLLQTVRRTAPELERIIFPPANQVSLSPFPSIDLKILLHPASIIGPRHQHLIPVIGYMRLFASIAVGCLALCVTFMFVGPFL